MTHPEIIILFFLIAAVYASAGFGGGSSYLAVLALYAVPMTVMRPTALLCNLVVVTGGTFIFWKNGWLNWRKIWPFLVAGIPLAFAGGFWPIKEKTFLVLLGGCLLLAGLLLLSQNFLFKKTSSGDAGSSKRFVPVPQSLALGGSIGLLSGLVGIGGGIFLSPVLHALRWDTPKHIAATASLFILVNSLAGLAGQLSRGLTLDMAFALPLLAAVLVGGQIGSRWSTLRASQTTVRNATAALTLFAGANLLWQNL